VLARLQPDNGAVCAYWIAALVSAIQPKSGTCPGYQLVALEALFAALYLHTGRIVPQAQRSKLCVALIRWMGDAASDAAADDEQAWRLRWTAMSLVSLLGHDSDFAACNPLFTKAVDLCKSQSVSEAGHACRWMRDGPWQAPNQLHGHDAMALPSAALVNADAAVRGAGLVASAFGMLHCRDAVAAVVARWAGLLDTPADAVVGFVASTLSVHVSDYDAGASGARARLGRWDDACMASGAVQADSSAWSA
jgi:hypothetical protein